MNNISFAKFILYENFCMLLTRRLSAMQAWVSAIVKQGGGVLSRFIFSLLNMI